MHPTYHHDQTQLGQKPQNKEMLPVLLPQGRKWSHCLCWSYFDTLHKKFQKDCLTNFLVDFWTDFKDVLQMDFWSDLWTYFRKNFLTEHQKYSWTNVWKYFSIYFSENCSLKKIVSKIKQVRNLCVYSRPGDRVWP